MAKKKKEPEPRLWFIYDQEEQAVAVSYARTESGALARFEESTGEDRENYRAEECFFYKNCATVPTV